MITDISEIKENAKNKAKLKYNKPKVIYGDNELIDVFEGQNTDEVVKKIEEKKNRKKK